MHAVGAGGQRHVETPVHVEGNTRAEPLAAAPGQVERLAIGSLLLAKLDGEVPRAGKSRQNRAQALFARRSAIRHVERLHGPSRGADSSRESTRRSASPAAR